MREVGTLFAAFCALQSAARRPYARTMDARDATIAQLRAEVANNRQTIALLRDQLNATHPQAGGSRRSSLGEDYLPTAEDIGQYFQ